MPYLPVASFVLYEKYISQNTPNRSNATHSQNGFDFCLFALMRVSFPVSFMHWILSLCLNRLEQVKYIQKWDLQTNMNKSFRVVSV